LNGAGFKAVLDKAQQEAQKAGKNISSSLGKGLEGALESFGGMMAIREVISSVKEMAAEAHAAMLAGSRLGISGEEFENLDAAAKKFGATGEDVATVFKKIAVGSVQARDGNDEMIAAFQTLGVTMDDLKQKSVKEIFEQIAGALKGTELNADRVAAIIKTMGKSADALIPAFKSGGLLKENPFGQSNDALKVNEQFGKDMGLFKTLWKKTWEEVLSPDANKDGAIYKTITWLAKKTRGVLGMTDNQEKIAPTNLKTVSAGELKAEKEADKKDREEEKKHLKEKERLEEELFRKQQDNSLKRMTNEQKILELNRREKAIQDFLKANPQTGDLGRLQAAMDIEDIRGERSQIENKKDRHKFDTNELQKIGAYANSPMETAALDLQKRSEKHLQGIYEGIKALVSRSQGGTKF
jgi:hypothetical protein